MLPYPPFQPDLHDDRWLRVPISIDLEDGTENTWTGSAMGPATIKLNLASNFSEKYVTWVICQAWQVAIFDPMWGDHDSLWNTLSVSLADIDG